MRGHRPGSTGTRAEWLLPLQRHHSVLLFHLFPGKEKLVIYASETSALRKVNFTLKLWMCRQAGHPNRDNGGNKCLFFFNELDLTARNKTIFKLYQENKPQFALLSDVIAWSSQESHVDSVCLITSSTSSHIGYCYLWIREVRRSRLSTLYSQPTWVRSRTQISLQPSISLLEKVAISFCQTCSYWSHYLWQSLTIIFKYSLQYHHWVWTVIFFFLIHSHSPSSSNYLDCVHTMKQNCNK